ncbi:MAG: hypothetical protein U0V70_09300 [Terriglobia bacterium]
MKPIVCLLLIVAVLGIYWAQSAIDMQASQTSQSAEILYLPSGKILRMLSLGHYGLIADIYWMRAVQYYGGKRLQNATQYELLEPLVDIATTLDPQLLHAYRPDPSFCLRNPRSAQESRKKQLP